MLKAGLELAWGASQLASQGKNLFGVKADPAWHGDVLTRTMWLSCIRTGAMNRALLAGPESPSPGALVRAGYPADPDHAAKLFPVTYQRQLASSDKGA